MLNIKKPSSVNFKFLFNFIYIGLMKFMNIGSKYFIVGFLIRVLGENGYGLLTWVDSIVQYLIIVINFGFDLYAAKHIVENKDNPQKLKEVISAIYYIKSGLFLLCFLLLIPLSLNGQINAVIGLIALMLVMGLGEVLNPIWFFQGIEKMKPITLVTFFTKLILLGLSILFVKSSEDIIAYILILVITNILWGVLGFLMLKKQIDFRFVKVDKSMIIDYLKEGNLFFIGKVSTFMFNLGTLFLIGYLFSKGHVAGFDIATKIIFVFIIPFEVLQQAIFPKVVRGIAKKTFRRIILATFMISSVTSLLLYCFSEKVIFLFGGIEMVKYSHVLNLVVILIPLICLTIIIANCNMIAKGLYKEYNWSLVITTVIFVLLLFLLKISNQLDFYNIILVRISADFIQLTIRIYYSFKRKII